MKAGAACAAVCLVAACTSLAPKATIEDGSRTRHVLTEEPHRAAVCIARNVDKHASGYIAEIRPGVAPALVHVEVRGARPTVLARLHVEGTGSIADIWSAPDADRPHAALVALMIAGC